MLKAEGLTSTLDPVALGFVLAIQPLGPFEETTITEPPPIESKPKGPPAVDEEPQGDPMTSAADKEARGMYAAIVDQTLNEIHVDFEPSLPKTGPSDVVS